ncbi:MAG: hypothetical protein WDM90_08520 [Ferruginibacter sp.]
MKVNLSRLCSYFNKPFIVLLFATFSTAVYAQSDSIDVFITNQMQKRKIPGLQLAIVRDGKLLKQETTALPMCRIQLP